MDYVMVKLILVVVGTLGLGAWQLYDVNRSLKKDNEAAASSSKPDQCPPRTAERRSDTGV